MAKIVQAVEEDVTRAERSLLTAGSSTTSSVLKPSLLVLLSKNLNRRDAFSQDMSSKIVQTAQSLIVSKSNPCCSLRTIYPSGMTAL